MTPAVALSDVSYRYPGTRAGVQNIDLTIAPGELVVCIGPSGCGKTTLLRLIAGFLRPDAGRVLLGGDDVTRAAVRERECGVVFQSYTLFPQMRVWENVAYPLRVRNVALGLRRERALDMLSVVGLSDLSERLPANLSGGQQQRVALARALIFKPRALLLDEPLSALDAATRLSMREEIRRVQKAQNIAALLITHDQDEALSLADRVVVLREGRLVQNGTPHAIYDRPADAFVAEFVGQANLLDGVTTGPDSVETTIGRIAMPPHGYARGAAIRLLVRPERVEPLSATAGAAGVDTNIFLVRVLRDAFFGATRQVELAVGDGVLKLQTPMRGAIERVRIPPEAVQLLPLS